MAVLDMFIKVQCDSCQVTREFEPPYVFNTFSGNSGHYDTNVSALLSELESEYCEEWLEEFDGTILCEGCKEEEEEE